MAIRESVQKSHHIALTTDMAISNDYLVITKQKFKAT